MIMMSGRADVMRISGGVMGFSEVLTPVDLHRFFLLVKVV